MGEAHHELAALDEAGADELVDGAAVAFGEGAEFEFVGLGEGGVGGGVGVMGGVGDEVEVCRCVGLGAGEEDFLGAFADVEAFAVVHWVGGAVYGDGAGCSEVDDADFATVAEVFAGHFTAALEGEGLVGGHDAADDGSIDVGVGEGYGSRDEEAFEHEVFAEFVGGHALVGVAIGGFNGVHRSNGL